MGTNQAVEPIVTQVSLTVSDLEKSIDFYQNALGFRLHSRNGQTALLGSPDRIFLELIEGQNSEPVSRTTGLYHFAVLVPSPLELRHVLRHLAENRTPLQGLSDHGVSEAIYLPDLDGNGIEIYRDRPPDEWPMQNGQLEMVTRPMNTDAIFSELSTDSGSWHELPKGTFLGHVHLHVRDIAESENFYRNLLGFDLVQRYGQSASFLSLNGYHHHIGINTWTGVGAPAPPSEAIGLRSYTINILDDELTKRLAAANWPVEEQDEGLFMRDPSGNGILLT